MLVLHNTGESSVSSARSGRQPWPGDVITGGDRGILDQNLLFVLTAVILLVVL
jgi:hypothetical protein